MNYNNFVSQSALHYILLNSVGVFQTAPMGTKTPISAPPYRNTSVTNMATSAAKLAIGWLTSKHQVMKFWLLRKRGHFL